MLKSYILLCLILISSFFISCEKEEKIRLEAVPEISEPDNETDIKIQEFLDTYQSKIIYRWDDRYTSSGTKVTPVKFEYVLPFIGFMEDIWINPFNKFSPGFMRDHLPIEIVLAGSSIQYFQGDERGFNAAGEATSFSRIVLAGINDFATRDSAIMNYQVITMHHEFAHILDKLYGRPTGFDDISKGKYAGSTSFTQFTDEIARERGFWIPYGMSNEAEDFATFVQAFLFKTKEEFLSEIKGNDLLNRKYKLVYRYYLNFGIDLHELNKVVEEQFLSYLPEI